VLPPEVANAVNASGDELLGPHVARLSDGSEVVYTWCKFVDQPSLKHLEWTEDEREKLQAMVENMHRTWTGDVCSLPPRGGDYDGGSSGGGSGDGSIDGPLVRLDPAQLVTPPRGYEVGYVPVVLRQWRGSSHGDASNTTSNDAGGKEQDAGSGVLSASAGVAVDVAADGDNNDDVNVTDVNDNRDAEMDVDDDVVLSHRTVSYTVALDHKNTRVQSAAATDGKSNTPYRRVVGGIVVEMKDPQPEQLPRPRPKKRRRKGGGCVVV